MANAQQGAYSVKIDGGNAGDHFGYTMGVCSDSFLSADGLPDIIVGAPEHDWGGSASGRLTWYSLDGAIALEVDRIDGATNQRWGNNTLESGVDLDGDGWDEILFDYLSVGRILSGFSPHSIMHSFTGDWNYLSFISDFDGDGVKDVSVRNRLYVGNGHYRHRLYVYSGANLSTSLLEFIGAKDEGGMGFQSSPAGNLDGDGFQDFVVLEPTADNQWIGSTGCLYALAGDNPGFGGREI